MKTIKGSKHTTTLQFDTDGLCEVIVDENRRKIYISPWLVDDKLFKAALNKAKAIAAERGFAYQGREQARAVEVLNYSNDEERLIISKHYYFYGDLDSGKIHIDTAAWY